MKPDQYISEPAKAGLNEYVFSQKPLWIMTGSILRENEPAIFDDIAKSCCFVFVGERGYGKSTMIKAFAGSACINNKYVYLEVPVMDFLSEVCSPSESINEFFDAFDNTISESTVKQKYFVYFEGTEVLIKYPSLCVRFMSQIKKLMKVKNAHIIFAVSFRVRVAELPSVFFSNTHIIELTLPDKEKRTDFISDRFKEIIKLCHDLSVDDLVECTEGLSYGELARFSDELVMLIKGKYLYENDLLDFDNENISFESDFLCPLYYNSLCEDIKKTAADVASSPERENSIAEAIADIVRLGDHSIGKPVVISSERQDKLIKSDHVLNQDLLSSLPKGGVQQKAEDDLNNSFNIDDVANLMLP